MFPLTEPGQEVNTCAALRKIIGKHLQMLEEKIFYLVFAPCIDCVRDPDSSASVVGMDVTLQEQEGLTGLCQDLCFKLSFAEVPWDSLWITTAKELPILSNNRFSLLLPFSTTYLCTLSF